MQKEQCVAKMVYFTRQRFARAIIDAETFRSLFVNSSRIFGIRRCTSCDLKVKPELRADRFILL